MLRFFEKFNKGLLFITLVSLIYRKGSFYNSFIPKPFEALLILTLVATLIYLVIGKKFSTFLHAFPKRVLVAAGLLVGSVCIGWIYGIFFTDIQTTWNSVLEFGTFGMGMAAFALIIFYTDGDQPLGTRYLYALLLPNFFMIAYFISHGVVGYFGMPNNNALDATLNPNVLSKVLLIPALFFIGSLLYSVIRASWLRAIQYSLMASLFIMCILWTVSRGAILSLCISTILVYGISIVFQFQWRRIFLGGLFLLLTFSLGYAITPKDTRQAIWHKVSKTATTVTVLHEQDKTLNTPSHSAYYEPRLIIWSFFPGYAFRHPLGVGPNTHGDFHVTDPSGAPVHLGPDNTYLEIWVWGGLLGIGSFLYLLGSAFVVLWKRLRARYTQESIALFGIVLALSIAIFFDASLSLYWFFIILALILRPHEISAR